MIYNRLGTSDLNVSKICLGTMTFGEQNSQEEGFEMMDYALEQGINIFDTAEMYSVPGRAETQGSTEKIIGNWMADRKARESVLLATKVVGVGVKYIRNGPNFSKAQIREAVEGSLKRLQTDYIDLYQLHWPERANNKFGVRIYPWQYNEGWECNFLDIIQTMNELINEGKIKHWGLSNETAWGMMKYIQLAKEHNLVGPVSTQNAYSLLNRQYEYGGSEVTQFEGVGLMAYSPLAFGALTGKYLDAQQPAGARLTEFPIFKRFLNPRAMEATKRYKELAMDNGMSVVQLALAFVNRQPFVHTNIIGATKLSQLQENIGTVGINLPGAVIAEVEKIFNEIPDAGL